MTDHSKTRYYEVVDEEDRFSWRVYHYDPSGNRVVVLARSDRYYDTPAEAEDACTTWQEENGVDATLA